MKKLLVLVLCICCMRSSAKETLRLTKQDKENLLLMVAEPMKKIEQKIESINQAASQIQNFIIDNYNQPTDKELKEQYHHILNKLAQLGLLLEALAYVVQAQGQATQEVVNLVNDLEESIVALSAQVADLQAVLGSLNDVSVGEQDFDSVDDIDEAQLSLISWLKTIYRQQLHDKFIS